MRIACVHQGYELYGSDRCFAESVSALRHAFPAADIEVVIPRPGPITVLLEPVASRIVFERLLILRRRNLLHLMTISAWRLPVAVVRAARRFRSNDLVYVNTTVVLDHALAARLFPGRALLHVHELATGRTLTVLRGLVKWSRAALIFNSQATAQAFQGASVQPASVIYNGIAGPAAAEPMTYDGARPLRVLMLGRFNRIKGQEILLAAVAALPTAVRRRLEVRIVGSAFEDAKRETALRSAAAAPELSSVVTVEPFVDDTGPLYRWADVVAVPSRLPESLGRVAIEAMAYGRPPIASAIGGLTEVVEHGRTGWLVPPDRADALAAILQEIIEAPAAWRDFPVAARLRYEALFSAAAASEALAAKVGAML
jgi:glycosyltransferase involved in cell wall biosynthesis